MDTTFKVQIVRGVMGPATAPFTQFSSANHWAIDVARGMVGAGTVTVVASGGILVAEYVADGTGRVFSESRNIGSTVSP